MHLNHSVSVMTTTEPTRDGRSFSGLARIINRAIWQMSASKRSQKVPVLIISMSCGSTSLSIPEHRIPVLMTGEARITPMRASGTRGIRQESLQRFMPVRTIICITVTLISGHFMLSLTETDSLRIWAMRRIMSSITA